MTGRVNEGSYYKVDASFLDESDISRTPSNVRYQIYCLTTNTLVRDWTDVTTGNTVTIIATPSDNAIQDDRNVREKKQMVVQSDYGTDLQTTQHTEWMVDNLRGVR